MAEIRNNGVAMREIWVVEGQNVNDEWVFWEAFINKYEADKAIGEAQHAEYWRVVRYVPAEEQGK